MIFDKIFHLDNVRKERRNTDYTEANKPIYIDQQSTQCGDYSSEIPCVLFFSCINLVKDILIEVERNINSSEFFVFSWSLFISGLRLTNTQTHHRIILSCAHK